MGAQQAAGPCSLQPGWGDANLQLQRLALVLAGLLCGVMLQQQAAPRSSVLRAPGRLANIAPGSSSVSTLEGVQVALPPWWNNTAPGLQEGLQSSGPWVGMPALASEKGTSQAGEDLWAWQHYFYNTLGGTYLEMGGLNGITYSNTRWLHRAAAWRGLLIEGSPSQYRQLVRNRPFDLRVNAAVCAKRQAVHYVEGGAVGGIVEFMSESFKASWHKGLDLAKTQQITCLPLAEILGHFGIAHIDFFSLDVEGGELGVLQSLDLSRVTFNVLVVESTKAEDRDAIRALLEAHGYAFQGAQAHNNWYVRKGWTGASKAPGVK